MRRWRHHGWAETRGIGELSLACCIVLLQTAAAGLPCTVAFAPLLRRAPAEVAPFLPRKPRPSNEARPAAALATRLHGIKKFRAWFPEAFPGAVRTVDAGRHPDTFDHVLVDTNSILHGVHRRSRSPEHAVKLLMIELDSLVARCRPRQSLVLAIDGSPAAAKVASQRKSRSATLRNANFKLRHAEKLRVSRRVRERRRRTYKANLGVLHLTPGTARMATLEATLVYWAWQRLQAVGGPRSRLPPGVQIWVSPSLAPGEGEVKLLEWINNCHARLARAPGQSIALVGSDADLLLGAMVSVSPALTHNVYVLRPDESEGPKSPRRNVMHCTSVWELTRGLDTYCRENVPCYRPEQRPNDQNLLLQMRTDLVLLFVLNGNDYLPRVVGVDLPSTLKNYLRLLRKWTARGSTAGVGLIDPDTLSFRPAFCAEYFRSFRNAPTEQERMRTLEKQDTTWTSFVSRLNDMAKMGFVPTPIRFLLPGDDQDDDIDGSVNGDDHRRGHNEDNDDDNTLNANMKVMRLRVGEKSEGDWHECSILVNVTRPLVKARSALSRRMLKEFDLLDCADSACEWEIDVAAPANVQRYLAGLVWTLQTYQDGVCPTYRYNYGRCLAPIADQIASYFVDAMNENRSMGAAELLGDFKPGGSVSAGVACLAALPISVKHLVPKPYSLIEDEDIEKFWAQSLDPFDNFLDMEKFDTLVNAAVDKIVAQTGKESAEGNRTKDAKDDSDPRRLSLGDHWTVLMRTKEPLQRSFRPPPPPVENLRWLRGNKHICMSSRVITMDLPNPPKATNDTQSGPLESNYPQQLDVNMDHTNFISFLNGSSVAQMPYKVAFESAPVMRGGLQNGRDIRKPNLLNANSTNQTKCSPNATFPAEQILEER